MQKDFDTWNDLKKKLEEKSASSKRPFFNEKEEWFVHAGVNFGHEIDGKQKAFLRPALVIKKYNKDMFMGMFLSTKNKDNKYYFSIGQVAKKDAFALLSQIKNMSANRLSHKIHKVSDKLFDEILRKLVEINFDKITRHTG